jgi:hypothetical protein
MKKLTIFLVLAALAAGLAFTNPDKADFTAWIKNNIAGKSPDTLGKIGAAIAAPALGAVTVVHSYGVCSIFETDLIARKQVTLGIFKSFIRIR